MGIYAPMWVYEVSHFEGSGISMQLILLLSLEDDVNSPSGLVYLQETDPARYGVLTPYSA